MPFREKGIPTALQIENYSESDRNPYYHSPQDAVDHINLEYFLEHVKTTIVVAGRLAEPIVQDGE